jgi:peptidoglycan pentaglycine glycine transferase (the first glycine)
MPEVSLADWASFLSEKPDAHFLQTGEWGELKSAFGWDPIRIVTSGVGAQVLFRRLALGFSIAYIPKADLGVAFSDASPAFWAELDALCHARHAILCKMEPDAWEPSDSPMPAPPPSPTASGIRQVYSPHSIQPRRTVVVRLGGPEVSILSRMKPKCRYNIGLARKKGVSVEAWTDLAGFHQMLQSTSRRDSFPVHSEKYYRRAYELFRPIGLCELFVARYEGRPLAALMVFARGSRAWYVYGGSADVERERMPNYLLQWEAMRWASERGCEAYDLWGVPDEDPGTLEAQFQERRDGLWGVYRFKRGFGGELQRSAQAVDRVYAPWLYPAYVRLAGGRGSA